MYALFRYESVQMNEKNLDKFSYLKAYKDFTHAVKSSNLRGGQDYKLSMKDWGYKPVLSKKAT